MNWKKPTAKISVIPYPKTDELDKLELVAYKFDDTGKTPLKTIELTDPDTGQPYTAEVVEYLGEWPIDQLPTQYAQLSAQMLQISGKQFGQALRQKQAEFKTCSRVLFLLILTA